MQGDEARVLLGFPPNSRPTLSQVKAAYRKKVWESHPDLFPLHEKPGAESKFKLISEAYTYLQTAKDISCCCANTRMFEEMAPLRSSGYIDPGWEHGIAQDERKKKVPEEVCFNMRKNLEGCRSGRKRRQAEFEQAPLAFHSNEYNDMEEASCSYKQKGKKVVGDKNLVIRIPGEVAYCDKAPEDVYLRIKENMKWHRTGRRNRKPESKEISTFYTNSDNEDEEEEQEGGLLQYSNKDLLAIDDKISDNDIRNNIKGRSPGSSSNGAEPPMKRSRLDSVFLKSLKNQTSSHYRQTKAKMGFEKKALKEVISSICKFFYHAGIPSNAANSPYFLKMLELVGQYGAWSAGTFKPTAIWSVSSG
ncbi:hypothetical protein D5086_005217 [Populus alba]|uniref:Uncharacterized protein n=1 Tax=Populus alba TaxID=43335 RepID=A0ACC4CU55_POPAL